MDKERGFEELLVPPIGVSEAEEDKKTEGGTTDIKQQSKPIVAINSQQPGIVIKKKLITIFKKKENKVYER